MTEGISLSKVSIGVKDAFNAMKKGIEAVGKLNPAGGAGKALGGGGSPMPQPGGGPAGDALKTGGGNPAGDSLKVGKGSSPAGDSLNIGKGRSSLANDSIKVGKSQSAPKEGANPKQQNINNQGEKRGGLQGISNIKEANNTKKVTNAQDTKKTADDISKVNKKPGSSAEE